MYEIVSGNVMFFFVFVFFKSKVCLKGKKNIFCIFFKWIILKVLQVMGREAAGTVSS